MLSQDLKLFEEMVVVTFQTLSKARVRAWEGRKR